MLTQHTDSHNVKGRCSYHIPRISIVSCLPLKQNLVKRSSRKQRIRVYKDEEKQKGTVQWRQALRDAKVAPISRLRVPRHKSPHSTFIYPG